MEWIYTKDELPDDLECRLVCANSVEDGLVYFVAWCCSTDLNEWEIENTQEIVTPFAWCDIKQPPKISHKKTRLQ